MTDKLYDFAADCAKPAEHVLHTIDLRRSLQMPMTSGRGPDSLRRVHTLTTAGSSIARAVHGYHRQFERNLLIRSSHLPLSQIAASNH